MDTALRLGFLNKPFDLDPSQDFHSALVVDGWISECELALVWDFYQAQLHSFLLHYERISLACADYSQVHMLSEQQEKSIIPSRPKPFEFHPPKELEPCLQPTETITTPQEDLEGIIIVGDHDQRETFPSDPFTATTGKHPLILVRILVMEKVPTSFKTEPTVPSPQEE